MPPVMGAAAFLMAEFLQVPYRDVALAAALPAVLYYFALFIQADLEAARSRHRQPIDRSRDSAARQVLKHGWHFLLPFAVLISALFWLELGAGDGGAGACGRADRGRLAFGYGASGSSSANLRRAARDRHSASLDLFMIGAAAGIIIGMLNIRARLRPDALLVQIGRRQPVAAAGAGGARLDRARHGHADGRRLHPARGPGRAGAGRDRRSRRWPRICSSCISA